MKGIISTLVIATLMGSFSFAEAAGGCHLKNLGLGNKHQDVLPKFNIRSEAFSTSGKMEVVARGSDVCSTFPRTSIAVLTFIDNTLVALTVENTADTEGLYTPMQKLFGKPETETDMTTSKKGGNAFWEKAKDRVVRYSVQKQKDIWREKVRISSKEHDSLFDKIAKEEEELLNQDIKKEKK